MHSVQVPSFFYTNMIGLPQGDELDRMWPFFINSWICLLISLGNDTDGVKSMGCLTSQCRGTPAGEVNMSLCSSKTLSICCCHAEGTFLEVMATILFFPWGQINRKKKFLVLEMRLLHWFVITKEMVVGDSISGILYILLPKVIIATRGMDSYRACFFHMDGWPNNSS
jgi:hypothetical protein